MSVRAGACVNTCVGVGTEVDTSIETGTRAGVGTGMGVGVVEFGQELEDSFRCGKDAFEGCEALFEIMQAGEGFIEVVEGEVLGYVDA